MKKLVFILFALIIFGPSNAQKLKKLGIEFESESYNFGDIQMWENQPAIFTVTNKSKNAISILPLFSENDLEIIYPEQAIQPGETAIIKAIYYTSGTGNFSRKFPIYFNTSPEAYDLKITGNIKSLSPTAYIQCPQAKPEHSKPKMELFGNIAEIESEIPLSGSVVKIVSLTSKNNLTFYADKNGNFGSNLPAGNYEVFVEHPNYEPHQSFFYLGQTSGHLKIRLTPITQEPILANNSPLPKNNTNEIEKKDEELTNQNIDNKPTKVPEVAIKTSTPLQKLDEENISSKNSNVSSELKNIEPEKINSFEITDEVPIQKETIKETTIPTEYNYTSTPEATTIITPTPTKEENYYTPTSNTEIKENYTYSPPNTEISPTSTPIINSKKYTVRIIDEKTLEPIEEALIFANPIYNKSKTLKLKSDDLGIAEMALEKEDYRIIVNADNYISGEAKIKAGQDEEIIRIYLTPVSNLFEDIYATKKKENNDDLLSQLSFGKTEFNFAEKEEPIETVSNPIDNIEQEQPIIEETPPPSLPNNVALKEETIDNEIIQNEPTSIEPALVSSKENEKINLDSIQRVLAEIEAEKLKMELELAKKELELSKKEALLAQQENELAKKDYELGTKNNELEQVKTNYNQSQEEIEKQKLALEELSKKETEKTKEAPISLELSKDEYAANNVLFLIDISSSMGKENKMELLKESIKSLAVVLRDIDRVAIIAYNQNATVVLESASGDDKVKIINAVDSLQTSGLTYGVNGLQTAYELLEYNYIGSGNNQIILATDGLFSSVNNTMTENELNKEVRKQVSENNIKLSVIGFGQDEDGEKLMEKLASNGSGQFIKIKNPWQAKTVLVDEIKINSKL